MTELELRFLLLGARLELERGWRARRAVVSVKAADLGFQVDGADMNVALDLALETALAFQASRGRMALA